MLSFFHCPTTRESFRNFRSLQLFSPLPNECQLFVPKDFLGPPCLTLPGEPLVLRERGWKEGGTQITSPLPQFYCSLSPRIHKHWISHFTVPALLKIFVRSRRDQEKKCRIGIRHSPSTDRYGFEKIVACPFCIAMPTSGGGKERKREGRESLGGADEWSVVMDDDDMRYFLHSFYMRHSESLEITCFYFSFCLLFVYLL
jgi:hypothetical protein